MNRKNRILVVDDDQLVLASIGALLRKAGFETLEVRSGEDALERLESEETVDALLSDLSLPDVDGIEVVRRGRELRPGLPALILTAYGSIENAVAAMREGAVDYLTKPIDDFVLVQKVRRALGEDRLGRENEALRERLARHRALSPALVFRHESMKAMLARVEAVAPTRATVLIQGESGTGKTVLARALHELSDRADGPFVEVSCGSLPDPLLESELFGYVRGAFTGAERDRAGKFEAADGGTMFLDEIANATPALQVKLLRVLQDRIFEPLGGNDSRQIDVRLVLATNLDLEALVAEGAFREDLFYRINVVTLSLPPLRDRRDDIPLLAEHFVRRFAEEYGREVEGIEPDVMAFFTAHDWPGNVRELENAVEHGVIIARGARLKMADLPPRYLERLDPGAAEDAGALRPLKKAMEAPEREYIRRALELNGGNRQKTAEMLRVNRTTLFNKMRKYGLF